MNDSYVGFIISFLLGGTVVWLSLKLLFWKMKVPRTQLDQVNAAYRDSIVENVKLEERISVMQEQVEELNQKLLKAQDELSIANGDKDSLRSMNEILYEKLNKEKAGIGSISQKPEE